MNGEELKVADERLQRWDAGEPPSKIYPTATDPIESANNDAWDLARAYVKQMNADAAERAERERFADDEWLYAQTRGTQFYLKWDCETREVFLNGVSLGIKQTRGEWLDLLSALGITTKEQP